VPEDSELTACFAQRVAAWFAGAGRAEIEDATFLRQMNMALALAASHWNELADLEDGPERMHAWLDEVERRAVVREATARAEAIRRARGWFEECLAERRDRG
jgi:hypothetical protein